MNLEKAAENAEALAGGRVPNGQLHSWRPALCSCFPLKPFPVSLFRGERLRDLSPPLSLTVNVITVPFGSWPCTRLPTLAGLAETLRQLNVALHAREPRLRMHMCKVWFPGWDSVPDDQLQNDLLRSGYR